ncbi:MAG: FRG domain-containing protein [Acidobacteriota bacterium]
MGIEKTKYGILESEPINNVEEFLSDVKRVTDGWNFSSDQTARPWFRGASNEKWAPLPTIFRPVNRKRRLDEFQMATVFRNRAPSFGTTPHRNDVHEWLYLMRHHGLPTRLLDWTEGALIALFFAVNESSSDDDPAVWMIHPIELNRMTKYTQVHLESKNRPLQIKGLPLNFKAKENPAKNFLTLYGQSYPDLMVCEMDMLPNTWVEGKIAFDNFHWVFSHEKERIRSFEKAPSFYPLAINATYNNPRIKAQKGCFTIHGTYEDDFEKLFNKTKLVKNDYFKKYIIDRNAAKSILKQLTLLGITYSMIYPDFDGLANELSSLE